MSRRFEEISDDDLKILLENRESLSTKNVVKGAVNILRTYCEEKHVSFPSENTVNIVELDSLLGKFYSAVRTKDGQLYTKKSMLSIRYGLQKHFEKTTGKDIVNSPDFSNSNKIFHAMLVKLKQEGKSKVQHKLPLSRDDLQKLYDHFDMDTPSGLQNKVFVDFMIYFCNRGRENLRDIKKSDFLFDENGRYIEMRDMATKNHKGGIQDGESQGGRMYKTDNRLCPYKSFMAYLSALNPGCDEFFQRPKLKYIHNSFPWYDSMPLGKNTLYEKMKKLSTEAKLSRVYTNHCLRATSITLLDGFEARHVMTISGHKSESSIRSYARTSENQREKMALAIAEVVSGSTENDLYTHSQDVRKDTVKKSVDTCDTVNDQDAENIEDISNMDFMCLTSSQENFLFREIQNRNDQDISYNFNSGQISEQRAYSETTGFIHHSNYVSPVYNIQNSVVHIHHHNSQMPK